MHKRIDCLLTFFYLLVCNCYVRNNISVHVAQLVTLRTGKIIQVNRFKFQNFKKTSNLSLLKVELYARLKEIYQWSKSIEWLDRILSKNYK